MAHAARGTRHQHTLPRAQTTVVDERLQRGAGGHRQRGGRRELDAVGQRRDRVAAHDDVLGERPAARERRHGAEHALARVAALRAAAHADDGAGEVAAEPPRRTPGRDEPQVPGADLPVERIEARRVHANLDLAGAGDRLVDVREMQHVGRTISFEAQCLHQRLTRPAARRWPLGRRMRTCSIGAFGPAAPRALRARRRAERSDGPPVG